MLYCCERSEAISLVSMQTPKGYVAISGDCGACSEQSEGVVTLLAMALKIFTGAKSFPKADNWPFGITEMEMLLSCLRERKRGRRVRRYGTRFFHLVHSFSLDMFFVFFFFKSRAFNTLDTQKAAIKKATAKLSTSPRLTSNPVSFSTRNSK